MFHGNNDYLDNIDDEPNNNGCPGCPCGSYDTEPNDALELCSAMLQAQNVALPVKAAFVSFLKRYLDV